MNQLISEFTPTDKKEKISLFIRLTTSYWHDGAALHQKKTLRFLKRKSEGFNFVEEDCNMIGAGEVFDRITNLDECDDGIYQIVTCNEWSSWETPHIIEDFDYKLIKVEDEK